jgi:hypothetical protein
MPEIGSNPLIVGVRLWTALRWWVSLRRSTACQPSHLAKLSDVRQTSIRVLIESHANARLGASTSHIEGD